MSGQPSDLTSQSLDRATADHIRNVVLVGHTGAGKTTLIEALLFERGATTRMGSIENGNTVTDFDEAEIKQQRSINLSLAPIDFQDAEGTTFNLNLLDAPGYPDFVGDLRAGLRGADAALFVVSAVDGIDGTTRILWDECAAVDMPRAIVVTKLDHPRADFDETVAIARRVFGEGVHPVDLVLHADDGSPTALINLITMQITDYSNTVKEMRDADPEHVALVQDQRNELLEAIIAESEDETLMERYLSGEEIEHSVLISDFEKAMARARFHPIMATSAISGLGLYDLLDVIVRGFPAPTEHPMPPISMLTGGAAAEVKCDANGPLVAEVIKTTTDPFMGRISLVRVFSGSLTPDQVIHVSGHAASFQGQERAHADHDVDERVGALASPLGAKLRPIRVLRAGDIGALTKLNRAETGDTISSKESPMVMQPWLLPESLLPIAIVAHSSSDEEKMASALGRLVAEDPTLRLEQNPETRQTVLWCMGQAHADVLLERLSNKYQVKVDAIEVKVSLRETFSAAANGHGKHVKQSGGHGQYAVCDIEVEPLPQGTGFEFVDKVVGGSVPRAFIPSVEKGVRIQLERGLVAGYPVVDLRVTLVDGKAHSVDSSDAAFQVAGALALKDAAEKTSVALLEPVDLVEITTDDEFVGAVMSDLAPRRGRVLGSESIREGRTTVKAEIPTLELSRYAIELRSLSHGTGLLTRKYSHHQPMPSHVATKVAKTSG
ncbi:MAG TPA: elongation factor G-like protein EF-G2 [Candidatus Nanopelagicaceae bacterium]|nr:elongation factor G-like protein EF-G2 [Candidatus Nanopelagicaceae bacterium]